MLQQPAIVPTALERIRSNQLTTAVAKRIYQTFELLSEQGVLPTFERLLLSFDEPEVKTLLVQLDDSGRNKNEENHEAVFADLCRAYERKQLRDSLRQGQAALESTELNEDEQLDLLKELLRKQQELIDR